MKGLGLEEYKTIVLIDEDGKSLSVEAFNTQLANKKSFSAVKNKETGTATLTIGKAPTASFTTIRLPVGSKMPPFQLKDTQGRVRNWEEFGNKPVILNFFFAECPPCIQEVPTLNAYAKQTHDVAVLSVTYESPATTQKFIDKHSLQWPVVADAREFVKALGIKVYPTLLLVSPDRTLQAVKIGGIVRPEDTAENAFSLDSWVQKHLK